MHDGIRLFSNCPALDLVQQITKILDAAETLDRADRAWWSINTAVAEPELAKRLLEKLNAAKAVADWTGLIFPNGEAPVIRTKSLTDATAAVEELLGIKGHQSADVSPALPESGEYGERLKDRLAMLRDKLLAYANGGLVASRNAANMQSGHDAKYGNAKENRRKARELYAEITRCQRNWPERRKWKKDRIADVIAAALKRPGKKQPPVARSIATCPTRKKVTETRSVFSAGAVVSLPPVSLTTGGKR